MLLQDDKVPMRWWRNEVNFGDLLGPWLVEKMTGKSVVWAARNQPHYLVIGSILKRTSPTSIVWGVGSFGDEGPERLPHITSEQILALSGPLTRGKLDMLGVRTPRIYGDPALLAPRYYSPSIKKKYELGIVLRWSEKRRKRALTTRGVKIIDLLSSDIEGVINQMLACESIISTSLHGMILADAYNIPNAWLIANTGRGKEFKFWDYQISVDKIRTPHVLEPVTDKVTKKILLKTFDFDNRPINIDLDLLASTNPFTHSTDASQAAERYALNTIRNSASWRPSRERPSVSFFEMYSRYGPGMN